MRGLTTAGAATALAILLLYTNLPVVASQRGVIPNAVAAVIPVMLLFAVTFQLVVHRRPVIVDRTLCALVAFLCVFLLSAFSAAGMEVALGRIGTFFTEGILIYFLVRNAVRSQSELHVAVAGILVAGSLLAGLTLTQAVTGNYDQDFAGLAQRDLEHLEGVTAAVDAEVGDEDRAAGPVGDPNRFAQILLIGVPLAFVLLLNAQRRQSRAAAALALALLLAGVLLTYSRGAFVTLVVLLVLLAPFRLMRPATLGAVMVAGAVFTPLIVPGFAERIASIAGVADLFGRGQVEADGPTQGRTTEMLAALAAYLEHPVLGVGPGQYTPYYSVHYQAMPEISIREIAEPRRAHNLYIEIGAETGTIGLVIFLSIPLLLLRDLEVVRRRLAASRPDLARVAAGFSLALLSYLGTGVFLHLSHERYYWFLIALTAAAAGILSDAELARREHAVDRLPASDDTPWVDVSRGVPC